MRFLVSFLVLLSVAACGHGDPKVGRGTQSVPGSPPESTMKTVADPLRALLSRMSTISTTSSELEDTDVREQMYDAIYRGFVIREPSYRVPDELGMFTKEGNAAVRSAIVEFLDSAGPLAERTGLTTPRARLDAFQDLKVLGPSGESFEDFFGAGDDI